jgi:HicB family
MKMSLAVDALRSDVTAVGELGDDTVAEVAERIATVLVRSVPGWVLDLLSEAAAGLTAEVPEGRVELRVAGDDVDLTYVADEPAPSTGADDVGESSARITLRLTEGLKARVEQSAGEEGLSVNTFIARTLEHGTARRGRSSPGGSRLRGYGVT